TGRGVRDQGLKKKYYRKAGSWVSHRKRRGLAGGEGQDPRFSRSGKFGAETVFQTFKGEFGRAAAATEQRQKKLKLDETDQCAESLKNNLITLRKLSGFQSNRGLTNGD
ncbi:hypothetical protein BaRGS_00013146, partial [Batillaria attramentaria]